MNTWAHSCRDIRKKSYRFGVVRVMFGIPKRVTLPCFRALFGDVFFSEIFSTTNQFEHFRVRSFLAVSVGHMKKHARMKSHKSRVKFMKI